MIAVTWAEPAWRTEITLAVPADGDWTVRPKKVWHRVTLGPFDSPEERAQAEAMDPKGWKFLESGGR